MTSVVGTFDVALVRKTGAAAFSVLSLPWENGSESLTSRVFRRA
jgi:hypothetical protein